MTRQELLRHAIETHGKATQMQVMIEEMAELTQAICKLNRHANSPEGQFPINSSSDIAMKYREKSRKLRDYIREEIADVRIMLEHMEMIFGDTAEIQDAKLARLAERLGVE